MGVSGAAGGVRVSAFGWVVLFSRAVWMKGQEVGLERLGSMESDCSLARCRSHVEIVLGTAWNWEWREGEL